MSTTDPRQPDINPIIPLTCSTWSGFAEHYIEDLAHGALCLAYPEPLPLLSSVTVQLSLPDSVDITLPARVVQVITGPHAEQLGEAYALALELNVEGETKRQLAQLVDFARTQRDGDSAQTSFARAMLEQTPSLPPREVALRLSTMPNAFPSAGPKRPASASTASFAAVSAAPAAIPNASGAEASQPAMLRTSAEVATTPSQTAAAPLSSQSGYRQAAVATKLRPDDAARSLTPAHGSRAVRGKSASEPASEAAPDPIKLKALLSSVARKQYDSALRITNELLEANPNDKQTQRWRALCYARIALTRDDHKLAAQAYQAMLAIDPNDREAREFLKAHERTKKLESLPFGRFFTKKK